LSSDDESIKTYFYHAGGVTHIWIDDDDDEELLEAGSGVMWPEANLPQSSRVWEGARY
jgi:hypothetical protein